MLKFFVQNNSSNVFLRFIIARLILILIALVFVLDHFIWYFLDFYKKNHSHFKPLSPSSCLSPTSLFFCNNQVLSCWARAHLWPACKWKEAFSLKGTLDFFLQRSPSCCLFVGFCMGWGVKIVVLIVSYASYFSKSTVFIDVFVWTTRVYQPPISNFHLISVIFS